VGVGCYFFFYVFWGGVRGVVGGVVMCLCFGFFVLLYALWGKKKKGEGKKKKEKGTIEYLVNA